jgi:hypothetical protein
MAGRGVISEAGADLWNGIELLIRSIAAGTEMRLKSIARKATTQPTMINIPRSIFRNPGARLRVEGDLRATRTRIPERVALGMGGAWGASGAS